LTGCDELGVRVVVPVEMWVSVGFRVFRNVDKLGQHNFIALLLFLLPQTIAVHSPPQKVFMFPIGFIVVSECLDSLFAGTVLENVLCINRIVALVTPIAEIVEVRKGGIGFGRRFHIR
jgi:hypothetical protein